MSVPEAEADVSLAADDRNCSQNRLRIEDVETPTEKTVTFRPLPLWTLLIPFSIVGVLIRLGLLALNNYPDAPVVSIVYPQIVGCVIIGWLNAKREIIAVRYYPAFVGLATGLCGSITTFSSWNLAAFSAFANLSDAPRSVGQNFLAGIGVIVIVLGMSIVSVAFGAHLGRLRFGASLNGHTSPLVKLTFLRHPESLMRPTLPDTVAVAGGLSTWLLVAILCGTLSSQRHTWFATIFGPIGTMVRYRFAALNGKYRSFPFGTFLVNIIGTAILGALYVISHAAALDPTSCSVITGLADGFCGCLTTVSTFVVELELLGLRRSYIYGFTSICCGQVVLVLIVGIFKWSHGLGPACIS
ncbi:uncharacterized protein SPPG_09047 [Spizellomyces punctatus DAOM BR117]|uniref:Fluoride ion transporter CrcB n=1 Tax=Spizellomyces punctatus (strain DAOM BR117) TaxID=645134 RepID=A0A0L0HMZ8_SPIPD|nr:uncharacterized protein SPPG_09047 [Spizellomyces punctatus DAOM BR117]KND02184.1 hypothetical protein SPPG_09047 [Spizellomyces punctatus DAOM BR117]|eukprot:XP_016610223.1 hypothetical protein SPPG_09047 [Spizellomyces punctatus DAOM BR117]